MVPRIAMGFCGFCGKELPVDAGFCSACGRPVASAASSSIPGQVPPFSGGVRPNLASEVGRIVAVIIDSLLLLVVSVFILIPFWLLGGFLRFAGSFGFVLFGPLTLLSWLLWLLYFTYFEATSGQTLGKMAMNIRVVDEITLQHLDFARSLVRNILRIIDYLPFLYLIGFILIATNSKKQRIGDMAARSVVVKA
jgi:uncharacterized RDD family membrane protein YckC